MDADFWHELWAANDLGFHEGDANMLLVAHWPALDLEPATRVCVPLCGKTRDIAWLLSKGHKVVGIELSATAIDQLFSDLGLVPDVAQVGDLLHYSGPLIDVFVGDIFDVTPALLGPVDVIYDRAALVALPSDMRSQYAAHLVTLTGCAPQLTICFEYANGDVTGPPFAIDAAEIARLYDADYAFDELSRHDVKLRGASASEVAWHLSLKGDP